MPFPQGPGTYQGTATLTPTGQSAGSAVPASLTITAVNPVFTSTFSGSTVPNAGATTLTISIGNSTGVALTGVGFSDSVPAGWAIQSLGTNTCGGTVAADASNTTVSLASGSLTVGANCSIQISLTAAGIGPITNTTSSITTDQTGSGPSTSATVTVVDPPTLTTMFTGTALEEGTTSTLTFTITNPNAVPLTGVTFSDVLPAGMTFASTVASDTCTGQTVSLTSPNQISFAGAIGAAAKCSISISFTGSALGSYTNTTSTVASNEGGAGSSASSTVTVGVPLNFIASFGANTVALNGSTSLVFSIENPNGGAVTGVSFTDTLPAGLQFAGNSLSNTCTGTTATAISTNEITFSGAIASNAFCDIVATVQATAPGSYTNTSSPLSSEYGSSNPATANIAVIGPPTLTAAVAMPEIPLGGTTLLTLTITNPNTTSLTGVNFSESLPAGLQFSAMTLTSTCTGASVSATGFASISFLGSLAANSSCSVSASLQGLSSGTYTASTSTITSDEGESGPAATANLTVVAPPILTEAFAANTVTLNGSTSLTFTIGNPNGVALTGVAFTDSLPAGLQLVTSAFSNACAGLSATATSATLITVSGTLPANLSCTISAVVMLTSPGSFTNTTSVISSNEGGAGAAARASLSVSAQLGIGESFAPAAIAPAGSSTVTFTITNPGPSAFTGVAFTDVLPAGLVIATPNNLSSTCSGNVAGLSGTGSIALTGGTMGPNGACSITVAVTAANEGVYNNITSALMSNEGGVGGTASASLTVAFAPTLAQTFSAVSVPSGGSAALTFSVNNPNKSTTLTGIAFTASLAPGLVISTPNGLTGACGAGAITALAGSSTITLAGASLPSGACTFTVNVTAAGTGTLTSTVPEVVADQVSSQNPVSATLMAGSVFAVAYAANLATGDSYINLTNTGENGAALYGPGFGDPAGNICANVYAFSPGEQLVACCSCLITPGALYSLSINNDVLINTYTAIIPTSVVVKVLGTLAGPTGGGTNCAQAAAMAQTPTSGVLAWRTTLHAGPTGVPQVTEVPFTQTTLSPEELASISNRCALIIGNGSGFGICNSCRNFGLGAERNTR